VDEHKNTEIDYELGIYSLWSKKWSWWWRRRKNRWKGRSRTWKYRKWL